MGAQHTLDLREPSASQKRAARKRNQKKSTPSSRSSFSRSPLKTKKTKLTVHISNARAPEEIKKIIVESKSPFETARNTIVSFFKNNPMSKFSKDYDFLADEYSDDDDCDD